MSLSVTGYTFRWPIDVFSIFFQQHHALLLHSYTQSNWGLLTAVRALRLAQRHLMEQQLEEFDLPTGSSAGGNSNVQYEQQFVRT